MFEQDIKRSIGNILKKDGYRLSILSKDCVYFTKRYSDELAFYIRCFDSRSNNNGILVNLYFVPIQRADDSIESLPVGIKINVANIKYTEFIDEVMVAIGKKIIDISKKLVVYEFMIIDELKNPRFVNLKWERYTMIKNIYENLNNNSEYKSVIVNFKNEWINSKVKKNRPSGIEMFYKILEMSSTEYLKEIGVYDVNDNIISGLAGYLKAQCELDEKI